jgi:phospholipid/cholesterol/gamma-HCH transport system permease protein
VSSDHQPTASFALDADGTTVRCEGMWTISNIKYLQHELSSVRGKEEGITSIDGSGIQGFDSAGAMLLSDLLQLAKADKETINLNGLKSRYLALYRAVAKRMRAAEDTKAPPRNNIFYSTGVWAAEKYLQIVEFIAFTGELFVLLFRGLAAPHKLPWRDLIVVLDENGCKALGIIALMSFLIGIVLAYQLAVQLKAYGANIFIVDTTGIAILREFAPLITAVIMAGRTSTAFAALIGTMKVNEEIDALSTMGIQPVQRLVLPRVIALLIAMPLLVVWADIFGVLGSMVMAKSILHIGFVAFLERFDVAVGLKHYILGLIKTPVFALVIAGVGCFQGFSVGNSAESVGQQTTKAAVQAIFLIIIVDALFSIFYSVLNL